MDQEQQQVDDITDEEVEALIALVEQRVVENLIRAIENALHQREAPGT